MLTNKKIQRAFSFLLCIALSSPLLNAIGIDCNSDYSGTTYEGLNGKIWTTCNPLSWDYRGVCYSSSLGTRNAGPCGNCGQLQVSCEFYSAPGVMGYALESYWITETCHDEGSCASGTIECIGSNVRRCKSDCTGWETSTCPSNGYYCNSENGNAKEYRNYGCSEGSCSYSTSLQENCETKPSIKSESAGDKFKIRGSVTDYGGCSLGQCTAMEYRDNCQDNLVLREIEPNSNSYTTINKNCQEYGSEYCSSNRYYRNEWGCSDGACIDLPDSRIGVDLDNDGYDRQCGDLACDAIPLMQDMNLEKDGTGNPKELSCTDGLDNDCDGVTDCGDSDCRTTVSGTIINEKLEPITGVTLTVSPSTPVLRVTTTETGRFVIHDICNTVKVDATHPSYLSQSKTFTVSPPNEFTLEFDRFLFNCESDCTIVGTQERQIHKECFSRSGCSFFDQKSAEKCDLHYLNQIVHYPIEGLDSKYVRCPHGTPKEIQCLTEVSPIGDVRLSINNVPVSVPLSTCPVDTHQ